MKAISRDLLEDSEIFFHTPSNTANQLLYSIYSAGEFHCGPGYSMTRGLCPESPVHDSCQVIYIEDGQGQAMIRGADKTVKAGDIVVMDCKEPHSYRCHGYWHTVWIHYVGADSRKITDAILNKWGPIFKSEKQPAVLKYIKLILDYFRKPSPVSEPILSGYIYSILMDLLTGPEKDTYMSPLILRAIRYIETRYREDIAIDDLASYLTISSSHLIRTFKAASGYTPYEYIMKTRIDVAKALLKTTDSSIKEIGLLSGFQDEAHFVSTFHKKTGITPRDFRYFGT